MSDGFTGTNRNIITGIWTVVFWSVLSLCNLEGGHEQFTLQPWRWEAVHCSEMFVLLYKTTLHPMMTVSIFTIVKPQIWDNFSKLWMSLFVFYTRVCQLLSRFMTHCKIIFSYTSLKASGTHASFACFINSSLNWFTMSSNASTCLESCNCYIHRNCNIILWESWLFSLNRIHVNRQHLQKSVCTTFSISMNYKVFFLLPPFIHLVPLLSFSLLERTFPEL